MEEKQRYHCQYHHITTHHHHYPMHNSYRARGGERKVGRMSFRNSAILSFMLIHFSTGNLYRGIPSRMQGLIASRMQGHITSRMQGLIISRMQGLITSHMQGLIASRIQGPKLPPACRALLPAACRALLPAVCRAYNKLAGGGNNIMKMMVLKIRIFVI